MLSLQAGVLLVGVTDVLLELPVDTPRWGVDLGGRVGDEDMTAGNVRGCGEGSELSKKQQR